MHTIPNKLHAAVEIVRLAGTFSNATLVDGEVITAPLENEDRNFLASFPPDVVSAAHFPISIRPGVCVHELINATEAVLNTFADFSGDGARCLALLLLTTWFADRIPAPPTVVLVAPSPAAGTAVLLVCSRLARRSLVLAADSVPGVAPSATRLCATVLADASAASTRSLRWAAGINARGVYGVGQGELRESACPRILLATEALPLPDSIQLPILPGRVAPIPDSRKLAEIAHEYGGPFAGYRLRNIQKFEDLSSTLIADPHGFSLLERNIASCVFDDEPLKSNIGELLHRQFGFRADFEAHDSLFVLTQVLVTFVHDRRTVVSVQEIATRMATLTTLRGDTEAAQRISLGRMLSKLGIRRDHTNTRNVVTLDPGNKNSIHQVAWIRGSLTVANLAKDCLFCDWLKGKEGLALGTDETDGASESEGCEESEENKWS